MALGLEQDAEVTAAGCQALVADLEVSHRGLDRRLGGWLRCVPLAKLPAPTRIPWVPPSLPLSLGVEMDGWFRVLAARSTRDRTPHLPFAEPL